MGRAVTGLAAEAWSALALPAASLARLSTEGTDALPSVFPVTAFAADAIGVAALAISELVASTGADARAPSPAVVVDRRLASLWFGVSIAPDGWALPSPWDAVAGDYATTDGWIRLHTNAPAHRAAALRVLGCAADRDAVSTAVATWPADALETAVVDAGGCAATMRSIDAWHAHPQGRAVAAEPLIDVAVSPAAPARAWRPAWCPDTARPLAGLKVLDCTRVLAGPVATRFLAAFGADVLRIDPPDWDEPAVVPDVTLGKRCARLDLAIDAGRATFAALLGDADILVHGYRPGALAALGFDAAARRAIRPDLVDVSLDAYGWTGPWAARRGFDSLVQMSAGIADAGRGGMGTDRPTPLPVQALDHATGYLMAAAAVAGMIGRVVRGEGSTVRLSLARTAHALVAAPRDGRDAPPWVPRRDDDLDRAIEATAWGPARRVEAPARVAGAPMRWDRPAQPLGSAPSRWHD